MDTIENISRKNSNGVIAGKEKIKKRLRVLGYIKNIDYRGTVSYTHLPVNRCQVIHSLFHL